MANLGIELFQGDIYKYAGFITYDGQLSTPLVVDIALEVNELNGFKFETDFGNFSHMVGYRNYQEGIFGVAARAFGLAMDQKGTECPVDPQTQKIIPTPELKQAAKGFIDSVAQQLFAVEAQVEDLQERQQNALWFQQNLPQLRQAILITDPDNDPETARTAREAAITAFIFMAPPQPQVQ